MSEEFTPFPQMKGTQFSGMSSAPPSSAKLSSLGSLFDRTFQFYVANFFNFFAVCLFFSLINFGSAFLILKLGYLTRVSSVVFIPASRFGTLGVIFYFIFLSFVLGYFSSALLASLIYLMKERTNNRSLSEIIGFGFKKGLSILWITYLFSFLVGGSTFLLVVPGIMFFIWFLFGQYIAVYENKKGMEALVNSRDLVKGYGWQIFLRVFIFLLLMTVLNSLLNFVLPDLESHIFISLVIKIFIEILIGAPLGTIFLSLIYEDLKRLKLGQEIPGATTGRKVKYILTAIAGFIISSAAIILINLGRAKQLKDSSIPTMPTSTDIPPTYSDIP